MVRQLAAAVLVSVGLVSPLAGQPWAKKMFKTTTHDFGTVARNAKAEYAFVLSNIYLEDVHVASARPSCGCISTRIENPLLKTYEKGAIVAVLDTKRFLGQRRVTLTVTLDQPFYARVYLHVKGYIRSDVVVNPSEVKLGTVDQGSPVEKTIAVSHRGRSDWRIVEVKSLNPHLTGEVVHVTRRYDWVSCHLRVRLDAEAPAGTVKEHLMLVANDRRSTAVPVLVEGKVVSGVTVAPASLYMGVVRPGEKVTKQLLVRGKKPFRITSVASDGDSFEIRTDPSDAARPIHVIPVTFVAGQQPGKVVQTIRIETDSDEAAEVATFAVVRP